MTQYYEVDGNTHDYEGLIVAYHENGTYMIHHSGFVSDSISTRDGKEMKSFELALSAGLVRWIPLDRAFGVE